MTGALAEMQSIGGRLQKTVFADHLGAGRLNKSRVSRMLALKLRVAENILQFGWYRG